MRVTHKNRAVWAVPSEPADQSWVYQLGIPLQLSATELGIVANIRRASILTIDLEIGNDLVILDQIEDMQRKRVVPLNRADVVAHPRSGKPVLLARYPLIGGFVPVGARRQDGSAHPHAGTGFAISTIIAHPADRIIHWAGSLKEDEAYQAMELQQYRYDGENFVIVESRVLDADQLCAGWRIRGPGLCSAIPDGDDLLMGFSATQQDGKRQCGVLRWTCQDGRWRIAGFLPVPGVETGCEATLVRDHDGAILFTARTYEEHGKSLRLWRSTDAGHSWETMLNVPGMIAETPITLNRLSDKTLYLSGNPDVGEIDSNGQTRPSIEMREVLQLWPLSADRRSLGAPVVVRDCLTEFGPAPGSAKTIWNADHPVGLNVRLRDGKWHHVLCYRVLTRLEINSDAPVTACTGMYVEEITGVEPVPIWHFEPSR